MVAVFAVAVARVVVFTVFLLVVLVEVAFVVIVVGEVVEDGGNDHCYDQALHFFFLIKRPRSIEHLAQDSPEGYC